MVRGSIRGAKEAPPPSGPQPVEAGKNIPGRIIWRVEYERREKRKRQKEKNEKEKEGEGKRGMAREREKGRENEIREMNQ